MPNDVIILFRSKVIDFATGKLKWRHCASFGSHNGTAIIIQFVHSTHIIQFSSFFWVIL